MNFQETSELVKLLKLSGATHFKSGDFEVSFGPLKDIAFHVEQNQDKKSDSVEQTKAEEQAKAKIKSLIDTINLSPEELANKMFPDGADR
jgi:hypothetical protein